MKKIDKKELHNIFCNMENNKEIYFNKLYEEYKKLVYAIAFSVLQDKDNSEDVVQKVYIKIWKMDKQNLPKTNEASWLYSITKNEAIDFIKNKKTLIDIDELYYISEEDKELAKIIDIDSYNKIISKLNDQEKEIISLKILSNLSFKEISAILNIPEGTVKWKYYKSLHTLKLLLGNLGMFIITATIGLKALVSNQKNKLQKTDETPNNENITNNATNEEDKSLSQQYENSKNQNDVIPKDETNEETNQTIIQEQVNTNNQYEITFLSISAIFLIFTIIFFIIFIKHQLKKKNKSSK